MENFIKQKIIWTCPVYMYKKLLIVIKFIYYFSMSKKKKSSLGVNKYMFNEIFQIVQIMSDAKEEGIEGGHSRRLY